jgi:hypothetical protein
VATVVQKEPANKVSRRRIITAAATVGVVGAAAIAAPQVVPFAEQKLQAAALGELKNLEGVSLDAAIEAAEITRAAVKVIVLPVATLVAFLGNGALGIVVLALQGAHDALSFFHLSTSVVDSLQTMVESWQTGLTQLPISLTSYASADITSAEQYLKALRKMVTQ